MMFIKGLDRLHGNRINSENIRSLNNSPLRLDPEAIAGLFYLKPWVPRRIPAIYSGCSVAAASTGTALAGGCHRL